MWIMGAAEDPANPVRKLVGTDQLLGFYYLAFAVDSLGFYCIEPRILFGQQGHGTLRTPRPLALTQRLWVTIQSLS
jgi:hypothetical protein